MDELKACPFGEDHKVREWSIGLMREELIQMAGCSWCNITLRRDKWQSRPVEDALQARINFLEMRYNELELQVDNAKYGKEKPQTELHKPEQKE